MRNTRRRPFDVREIQRRSMKCVCIKPLVLKRTRRTCRNHPKDAAPRNAASACRVEKARCQATPQAAGPGCARRSKPEAPGVLEQQEGENGGHAARHEMAPRQFASRNGRSANSPTQENQLPSPNSRQDARPARGAARTNDCNHRTQHQAVNPERFPAPKRSTRIAANGPIRPYSMTRTAKAEEICACSNQILDSAPQIRSGNPSAAEDTSMSERRRHHHHA